jgi:hypothetical protein
MRSYLIVANRTLASPALSDAIDERLRGGPCRFHVVVPATPTGHRMTWDEDESRGAAQERLDTLLEHLRGRGAQATGEIGAPDPIDAAADALRDQRGVEEVILSTLPSGRSRWLGLDVPGRLRDVVRVPVTVVTQAQTGATTRT